MKDAKWFTNQVALVTGASGGLGAQIALELAKRDVQLILVARNTAKLEQVAAECKTFTTKPVDVYSCDLTDDASVNQLLATLDEAYKITMVINNAGLGYLKLAKDLSESEINQMLQLNLNTLIKITQYFVLRFIEDKSGVIVNIASQAGKSATVKSSVYSATKFGVLGYSNALRLELKPYGIHVMTVNPGFGGQKYIPYCGEKVRALRQMITEKNLDVDIQVDGGVKASNIAEIAECGANIFVCGSAVFEGDIQKNVKEILEQMNK